MELKRPWLVIITLSCSWIVTAGLHDGDLLPTLDLQANVRKDKELLRIGSETKRYRLLGLRPGTSYEARVSHPATIPVRLEIQIGDQPQALRIFRRKLLDCDKIIFHVAADGSVQEIKEPVLLLTAAHLSVHRDGPQGAPGTLIYNVVVQELWLGIPTDTFPVISAILILLGVVVLLLPWWVDTALPRLEQYLQGGTQVAAVPSQPLPALSSHAGMPRSKIC